MISHSFAANTQNSFVYFLIAILVFLLKLFIVSPFCFGKLIRLEVSCYLFPLHNDCISFSSLGKVLDSKLEKFFKLIRFVMGSFALILHKSLICKGLCVQGIFRDYPGGSCAVVY